MLHYPQLGGGAFTDPHGYRYSRRVRNALVVLTSPPALGLGCAQGRHPPPTGSVCVLREHMHAGRRQLSRACCPRAGATAAARSPPWSVRSHATKCCVKNPGAESMRPETLQKCTRATMTSPHPEQPGRQLTALTDMSKLPSGPVLQLPPPPPYQRVGTACADASLRCRPRCKQQDRNNIASL